MSYRATPERLRAVPLAPLLARMLTNLNGIYTRSGDICRTVRVLRRLRQLCPEKLEYLRELGLSMLCLDQPGKAIDPLTEYLSSGPAEDDDDVRQLLERARRDVSKWN
jgi:regulator of sirC expression with transglutaminase-like and TPR domain